MEKGKAAFINYYRGIFQEETEKLLESLTIHYPPVLWFLKKNETHLQKLWYEQNLPWKTLRWYPQALVWPESITFPAPLPGLQEKLFYPLTSSSLLPVLALDLKADDIVLDACAAPGGKSLIIADTLEKPNQLTVNDISPNRMARLKQTLRDYGLDNVPIMNKPAERLPLYFKETFNKILADVPCSSEMHVWNDPKHLENWSQERVKKLSKIQLNILKALFKTLKPGGLLVYSTCALTPEENEQVIAAFLDSEPSLKIVDSSIPPNVMLTGFSGAKPLVSQRSYRVSPHIHHQSPAFLASIRKPL